MNKNILIGQKNIEDAKQPTTKHVLSSGCSVGVSSHEAEGLPSLVAASKDAEPCVMDVTDESEGKEKALVVGCNANNGNASARTANCYNAVANSDDNYAGAFAVGQIGYYNEKSLTSQATSLNMANNQAATGGHGLTDYRSLPFWGEDREDAIGHGIMSTRAIAEEEDSILEELGEANRKRKLKNLKRFMVNPRIVRMGVERCLSRASDSPEVRNAKKHKEAIVNRIIRELTDETYHCGKPRRRVIEKRGKGDKNRNADIYTVYDRCVQNIILLVIGEKLTNKIPRTCYSGIKGRSLWSNEKAYCMVNQIRTFVKNHPKASAGLTDIRHFYESLRSKVVLGVLFETIVCPYMRRLLCDVLLQTETLVIGGTLSQLFAMLVLADMDNELMKRFSPKFYGSFGDNRIIMDDDRQKVVEAVHWEMSYLDGRYGMQMKNDYQVVRVGKGFMFCKQHFHGRFVNVRAELRRRAIRGAIRGKQHYAGYHGMLLKTDSKRLIFLINNNKLNRLRMKNQKGMSVRPMAGDLVKLNKIEGKKICITDYAKRTNNKDSEYFIRFQFVLFNEDGSKRLCVSNNGSYEIKEFFKLVDAGSVSLPLHTRVCAEGVSYYFEQFHTSSQEACDLICAELGI